MTILIQEKYEQLE